MEVLEDYVLCAATLERSVLLVVPEKIDIRLLLTSHDEIKDAHHSLAENNV